MSTKDIHQLNIIKIIKTGYVEKKLFKGTEVLIRKKKKTNNNMIVNDTKIYQKVKNKREKKREKMIC